jgi:DNA-binding transcriptional MerR regulator
MFKIGDFSRLSRVSVRMLRHYDDLGLLRPAHVDPQTGYRYYAAEQLSRLHRILALNDLGFTLEEVGELLRGGVSPAEVTGMLKLKRAELRRQLDEGTARLARIEARLASEGEPDTEVVLKQVPAQTVAACRAVIPTYLDGTAMLLQPVLDFLSPHGLRPSGGGWLYVYHDPDFRERRIDAEAAVPLPRPVPVAPPPESGVAVYELPAAGTVASAVHAGDVADVGRAYGALGRWIVASGYRITGPNRLIALRRDPADPARSVTEVQWPVERVP